MTVQEETAAASDTGFLFAGQSEEHDQRQHDNGPALYAREGRRWIFVHGVRKSGGLWLTAETY